MSDAPKPAPAQQGGFLNFVERLGNLLPDPVILFLIGTVLVMVASEIAVRADWVVTARLPQVQMEEVEVDGVMVTRPKTDVSGEPLPPEWIDKMVDTTATRTITQPLRDYSQVGEDGEAPMVLDENGEPVMETVTETYSTGKVVEQLRPKSLLSADGIYWAISSMVDNFINFAPLGVVLVGMLGIGVAERVGLIAALLKGFMMFVPARLLTPAMVFLGVMSSMGVDAGYVVLPPLAAALYKAAGRSPLAGLAAVFAGVAAGFNANLFITGLDPMLAQMSAIGAQVVDSEYQVNPACNWYFAIASTFIITLVGWWVTAKFVEPRLSTKSEEEGGPAQVSEEELAAQRLTSDESGGLVGSLLAGFAIIALVIASVFIPNTPLYGPGIGTPFDRWTDSIVPILFLLFLVPALWYGRKLGKVKDGNEAAKLMVESIAGMAPIVVLAFFAGQFIEHFKYSGLDKMLALSGGQYLGQLGLSKELLIIGFIFLTMVFNLFVGSMSAKYAMFAPIFIPMLMMVGISPELTQAAYRVGDSVSNSITPLNPYMVIILVFMQRFVPKGGMGTLISTMLPYSIAFLLAWTLMLVAWMTLGLPLGDDGGLSYVFSNN